MFRPSALNVETNDSENEEENKNKRTKEAQEMQAFDLYNKALQLQRDGDHRNAILVYEQLLKTSLVSYAATTLVDKNGEATEKPLKDPGLILKYSTHKNIASMSDEQGNINSAMDHYLKAVMLDTTDVTLWQRIGNLSMQVGRLPLACHAFTSGLRCNENHWPCLDAAILVYYALIDYHNCLYWIAKALAKDPNYLKGLVFMKKIFKECPQLKRDTDNLFQNCSFTIHDPLYCDDLDKKKEYIDEAMQLREKYREISVNKPLENVQLKFELQDISWVKLGEGLLGTYDFVQNTNNENISFSSEVELKNLKDLRNFEMNKIEKSKDDQADLTLNLSSEEISEDSQELVGNTDDHEQVLNQSVSLKFKISSQNENEHIFHGNSVSMVLEDLIQAVLQEDCKTAKDLDSKIKNHDLIEKEVNEVIGSILDTICSESEKNTVKECPNIFASEIINNIINKALDQAIVVDENEIAVFEVLENILQRVIGKHSENTQVSQIKTKKSAKRKINYLDFEDSSKRRSQRVRTSNKYRKKESIIEPIKIAPLVDNFQMILNLLPEKYRKVTKGKIPNEHCPTPKITERTEAESLPLKTTDEYDKVLDFIEQNIEKRNVIVDFMENYCFEIGKRAYQVWSKGEKEVLVQIFANVQTHVLFPKLSELDERQLEYVSDLIHSMLNCMECQVDLRQNNTLDKIKGCNLHEVEKTIFYLAEAGTTHKLFKLKPDDNLMLNWKKYCLRFLWLRSKHSLLQKRNMEAVNDVKTCKEILEQVLPANINNDLFEIKLPNLTNDSLISMGTVNERLEILERAQTLCEVKNLFNNESYTEVIALLQPTFTANFKRKAISSDRIKQMKQIVLSYSRTNNVVGMVKVIAVIIPEILFHVKKISGKKNVPEPNQKKSPEMISLKEWNSTLHFVLQNLDQHISTKTVSTNVLTLDTRIELIHNIVACIDFVFEYFDKGKLNQKTNITTLTWIVLYKLIKVDETQDSISTIVDIYLPNSFNLLNQAHEWLADREICCISNGSLLKFYIQEIKERFGNLKQGVHIKIKEKLENIVQQCFSCLYGFPVKSKSCRIQDHNSKQLTHTWVNSLEMFEFFRPKHLPEFDSFKTSTVNFDLSQFLLKTIQLVTPQLLGKIPNSEMTINSFIESDCQNTSVLISTDNSDLNVLADMYYLLADYFFKNNEINKALKYYLLDIRINQSRFDSWAGMALARESQTDDLLRLCEVKKSQHNKSSNKSVEYKGMAGLSCFKRALSFDSNSVKLWIECGSLAYWLHSVYSRKLKRSKSNPDKMEKLGKKSREMLKLAHESFESVRECDNDEVYEEEWLVDYMCGKIGEKKNLKPQIYLDYFQSAAELLHNRNARYPKKIQTKYGSISEFAIEALEIYFRIHCSVLKQILKFMKGEVKHKHSTIFYMRDLVKSMAKSPFALREENKYIQTVETSKANTVIQEPSTSKLFMTSQSSDLTMGSLLPDNILQSLNIETADDEILTDTPSETMSPRIFSNDSNNGNGNRNDKLDSSDVNNAIGNTTHVVSGAANDKMIKGNSPINETENGDHHIESVKGLPITTTDTIQTTITTMQSTVAIEQDLKTKIIPSTIVANKESLKASESWLSSGKKIKEGESLKLPLFAISEECNVEGGNMNLNTKQQVKPHSVGDKTLCTNKSEKIDFSDPPSKSIEHMKKETPIAIDPVWKPKNDNVYSKMKYAIKSIEAITSKNHEIDKINALSVIQSNSDLENNEDVDIVCEEIIDHCEVALKLCLQRYTQHHKALYRLADLYANYSKKKNLLWAKDLLYGSTLPWQQLAHMPSAGLLSDRNKTNIFNGVWRIPMDDIDRPGSFPFHLCRCVELLITVLRELKDSETLLKIHNSLNRIPDHGRKYLRDVDRIQLARRALVFCRSVLNRKIKSFDRVRIVSSKPDSSFGLEADLQDNFQGKPSAEHTDTSNEDLQQVKCNQDNLARHSITNMGETNDSLLNILMECYKVYQETQKHPDSTTVLDQNEDKDDTTHQRLLVNAYNKYTCSVLNQSNSENKESSELNENQIKSKFEQAVKFCQQQINIKKQNAVSNLSTHPKSNSKHNLDPDSTHTEDKLTETTTDGDIGKNGTTTEKSEQSNKVVQMVEKEGVRYTRIGLPPLAEGGAFKPTKKLRGDPKLRHLMIPPHTSSDSPDTATSPQQQRSRQLIRSTSVPACYTDGQENTPPHPHRPIFRTGSSVSDYTKLKLKTSILAKTSASLVRKPSITDFEIRQIHLDDDNDSDSSQSDDDEVTSLEGAVISSLEQSRKRKLSEEDFIDKPDPVSPIHAAVITTAGST